MQNQWNYMERGGDLNKLIEKGPKSLSYILISSESTKYSLLSWQCHPLRLHHISCSPKQFPKFRFIFPSPANDDDPSIKCGCCKNWDNEMSVLNNMVAKFIWNSWKLYESINNALNCVLISEALFLTMCFAKLNYLEHWCNTLWSAWLPGLR